MRARIRARLRRENWDERFFEDFARPIERCIQGARLRNAR